MEANGTQRAKTTLHQLDLQAADQFAIALLHDINNPLEAATSLAYLVHEEADQSDRVRQHILLLQEQLANITAIARQALSFYKEPKKALNLVEVAEAAVRVHDARIQGKALRVHRAMPVEAFIYGHAGEMLQVLCNLLGNAIDALHDGGDLSLRIRDYHGEIRVLIVDTGHGIPDAVINEIFTPLFTTKGEQGTGLGLAIAKSIIEKHGGTIRVRSSIRPDRSGTAFRICIGKHFVTT